MQLFRVPNSLVLAEHKNICFLVFFFFESGSLYAVLAVLELVM